MNRMTLGSTDCCTPSRGNTHSRAQNTWAVILAAGEGARSAGGVHGRDQVPSQFASPRGEQTLLQQTVARLEALVSVQRIVVVVARDRRELAEEQLRHKPGLEILSQPEDSGTAPAIFFALSFIQSRDANARVVVTPSDQHLVEPGVLMGALARAMSVCDSEAASLVLIGAEPDGPGVELGWILPDGSESNEDLPGALRVHSCVEKPPAPIADAFHREGGLWNTHIMVGNADAFWSEGQRYLPRQVALFEEYLAALRQTDCEDTFLIDRLLARLYRRMPPAEFSRSILECTHGLVVVPMRESGWTDCGKSVGLLDRPEQAPDRRQQVLRAILRSMRPEQTPTPPQPSSIELLMNGFLGTQSEPA